MSDLQYVQIIDRETKLCVEQMEAHGDREAERIKRGASINLNHKDYQVKISAEKMEVHK